MFKANEVLYEVEGLSKWQFAYMKSFDGSEEFIDCAKTKSNICRK